MNRYPRYAIYYAPAPPSAWWRFGCAWLGRDPATDRSLPPMAAPGLSETDVTTATATPRRYGFHATLKAPFALADGISHRALERALAEFAQQQSPIQLHSPHLRDLDSFIALCPETTPAVQAFAQSCVEHFDRFRAAPTNAEVARRREIPLTPRQLDLLQVWGYPYVAEEYRLHFTLTGRLPDLQRDTVRAALTPAIDALRDEPLWLDALCLFEQDSAEAPFRLTQRHGFDGSLTRYGNRSADRTGRLFYVVGPSGAGKDTLLHYARMRVEPDRPIVFAHRYITRSAQAGGENHVALSETEFAQREDAGAFAMVWHSHGNRYGIGVEIDHWMAQGLDVIVNGSRAYLPHARARYPGMIVVWISATRDVLQARLSARGRESAGAAAARLARADAFSLPPDMPVVEIRNDTALPEAGEQLLRVLKG